jgi:hypothetical protein
MSKERLHEAGYTERVFNVAFISGEGWRKESDSVRHLQRRNSTKTLLSSYFPACVSQPHANWQHTVNLTVSSNTRSVCKVLHSNAVQRSFYTRNIKTKYRVFAVPLDMYRVFYASRGQELNWLCLKRGTERRDRARTQSLHTSKQSVQESFNSSVTKSHCDINPLTL